MLPSLCYTLKWIILLKCRPSSLGTRCTDQSLFISQFIHQLFTGKTALRLVRIEDISENIQNTRAITKGDEYPQQDLAKELNLFTEYQPEVTSLTCKNLIKGQ